MLTLVQMDHVSGHITRRSLSGNLIVPHNGSPVPLADVLAMDVGSSLLAEFRQKLRAALNLDDLECVVLPPEYQMPEATLEAEAWSTQSGVAASLDRAKRSIGIIGALRWGAVRSTMSPWRTVRVLNRLHRLGRE